MSPAKTPKWWVPQNAEQKKAFESGKDDVIIALSVCKEGVCVKKCINIIAESTGSMIPYRKMGFDNFQEFLFHIDDVLEVRCSYTESNRYYLFVRECAMSDECRHIRRLVEGQVNAKTNRGQVRATYRNTRAVSSDVLVNYTPNRYIAPIARREEVHQVPRNYSSNSTPNPIRMASMVGYGVDDDSDDDDEYGMFDMVSVHAPVKPPAPIPVQQNLPRPKTPEPQATHAKPDVLVSVTRPEPDSPVHGDVTRSQVNTEDNSKSSNFLDSKGKQRQDESVMAGLMVKDDADLGVICTEPETNEVKDDDSNTNEEVPENDTSVRLSSNFRTLTECFLWLNKSIVDANRFKINDLEGMTKGISDEEGYETGMESRIQRNDDGSDEENSDWEYPVGVGPTNIDWVEKEWQDPSLPIPLARVPLLKMITFKLAQYENEENFKLVSVRNMEEIHKLTADMTSWYNVMKGELPEIQLEDLSWNGIYAGFDITRNEWTRVQLDLKNGVYKDKVLVFNIDSGIKSRMQRRDLRYLLPKYAIVARRAYLAKLYSRSNEPLPNKNTTREFIQVGELHRACVVAQVPDKYNGVPWLVLHPSLASLFSEKEFRNHVHVTLHRLAHEVGANVPADFWFF